MGIRDVVSNAGPIRDVSKGAGKAGPICMFSIPYSLFGASILANRF